MQCRRMHFPTQRVPDTWLSRGRSPPPLPCCYLSGHVSNSVSPSSDAPCHCRQACEPCARSPSAATSFSFFSSSRPSPSPFPMGFPHLTLPALPALPRALLEAFRRRSDNTTRTPGLFALQTFRPRFPCFAMGTGSCPGKMTLQLPPIRLIFAFRRKALPE